MGWQSWSIYRSDCGWDCIRPLWSLFTHWRMRDEPGLPHGGVVRMRPQYEELISYIWERFVHKCDTHSCTLSLYENIRKPACQSPAGREKMKLAPFFRSMKRIDLATGEYSRMYEKRFVLAEKRYESIEESAGKDMRTHSHTYSHIDSPQCDCTLSQLGKTSWVKELWQRTSRQN